MYDYGFRIYNPQLGRFLSVDPLSPDYPWYTPYQFAGNTPIQAVDVDGLEPGFSYSPTALNFGQGFGANIVTDYQAIANARARGTVATIFNWSGGYSKYTRNYVTFMSAGNTAVANGGMATEEFGPAASTGGNTESTLYLREDKFSSKDAINFMLGNMIAGQGPTNIDYPINGASSTSMLESAIVIRALRDFRKANPYYTRNDGQANNITARGYTFQITDLASDFLSEFTLFTTEGFVGSGQISVIYDPEDHMVDITIQNTTSLKSGDYGKEIPGVVDAESHDRTEENPEFGSVSQTYRLRISMSEALKER